jgi:DNA-binding transcriptional MerR regulator
MLDKPAGFSISYEIEMTTDFYPIRAVANLTGIALDTLRAWERRYQAVTPEQGPRGRLYSEREVQRLILLRDAVAEGYSIGQIASRSDAQLKTLLGRSRKLAVSRAEEEKSEEAPAALIAPVLGAIERFDYAAAEFELSRLAASMSDVRQVVHAVALPLMRITGDRWHRGRFSIAQEHMVSTLLSAMLGSLIRVYSRPNAVAKMLFATPVNERHGFPVLAAAMLAAAGGLGVVHLGTDLPGADMVMAQKKTGAAAILLGVVNEPSTEVTADLRLIARKVPATVGLWLGGHGAARYHRLEGLLRWVILDDYMALERKLVALGAEL